MPRPPRAKVCSTPGCPAFADPGKSRCHAHDRQADNAREGRGIYSTRGHRAFRRAVLRRDPLCVLCRTIATAADHHPRTRLELVEQGAKARTPTTPHTAAASAPHATTKPPPTTHEPAADGTTDEARGGGDGIFKSPPQSAAG